MNKKTIFIASHCMEIGGAERSLLGLLETIDYEKYEVDLFLYRHTGELLSLIHKKVNLLPEDKKLSCLAVPYSQVLRKHEFSILYGRLLAKLKTRKFEKQHQIIGESQVAIEYSHKYTKKYISPIMPNKEYDLAISFLTPHYIVAEKVRAKKKIAWIHTDYSSIVLDTDSEMRMWEQYDYIASISESCTQSFLKKFPSLKTKIFLMENILSEKFIQEQSAKSEEAYDMSQNDDIYKLLSIGRFCEAKNFQNIPIICKKIRESQVDVKWYIIGFGAEEELIREKIHQEHMEEHVIILGKKSNPYPYIKNCDFYVQPSKYEGKCVTVREAQMLHKPVIITNYPTAKSQLENGIDGMIVPLENDACAQAIVNILQDKKLKEKLIENTKRKDYSNAKEIEKLYEIIDQ